MSDFTRRHYEAIAHVLWRIIPETPDERLISRSLLISDLCDLFAQDNERFDEKKFREAIESDDWNCRRYKSGFDIKH